MICMFALIPVPCCFDYCSLIVGFEIRKSGSLNLVLLFPKLFQPCGATSTFHMNLMICVSISTKKAFGNLIVIILCLYIAQVVLISWQYCFPIQEHRMSFHLFRSSVISATFCSFQCASLSSLELNLFPSILFFYMLL